MDLLIAMLSFVNTVQRITDLPRQRIFPTLVTVFQIKKCIMYDLISTIIGYRCVFCRQYNPPRQVKPAAEKLPDNTVLIEEMESGSEINSPRSMASSISPGRDAGASETLEKEVATESQDDGNSEDSVTPNSDKLNEPSGIESVTTDAAETDSHKSETVERQPEALSVEPEEGTNTGTSAEKVESSSSAFEPFELMDTENETGSSLPLPTKGSESSESNLESLIEAAADLQIG